VRSFSIPGINEEGKDILGSRDLKSGVLAIEGEKARRLFHSRGTLRGGSHLNIKESREQGMVKFRWKEKKKGGGFRGDFAAGKTLSEVHSLWVSRAKKPKDVGLRKKTDLDRLRRPRGPRYS